MINYGEIAAKKKKIDGSIATRLKNWASLYHNIIYR